jgi:hypothetical protein
MVVDAETDLQLVDGVVLAEGRGKTFVELGFEALDGTNDGYGGRIVTQTGGDTGAWPLRIALEAVDGSISIDSVSRRLLQMFPKHVHCPNTDALDQGDNAAPYQADGRDDLSEGGHFASSSIKHTSGLALQTVTQADVCQRGNHR